MMLINATSTYSVVEILGSPKGRLAQIELLVCSAVFLYFFLVVFGGNRQRSNSKPLRMILSTAHSIPPFLFTYTVGLMNAELHKNKFFPIWATFLIMLLGSADSFSGYVLEDKKQWRTYYRQFFIKMIGLALLLPTFADASFAIVAIGSLCIVVLVKVSERVWASQWMSKSMPQWTSIWLAVYMRSEHLGVDEDVDLTTMKGIPFTVDALVDWKSSIAYLWKKKGRKAKAPDLDRITYERQIVTVENVWQCQGKLLREDRDHHIKDLCLSFALSTIFISRFISHPLPQEVRLTCLKLLMKILKHHEDGYERAFRIIEVELAFTFNRLFTKYPLFNGLGVLNFVKLVFTIIGSCVVASTISYHQESTLLTTENGVSIDILVTYVVIFTVLILEILQILFICFSKWGKVFWICHYTQKTSWQRNKYMEKMIGAICRIQSPKPWERKLHQYSLLHSYGYSPPCLLYNTVTALFIDQVSEGQKEIPPIELSREVKSAVISFIVNISSELSNGEASLTRNGMAELSWACNSQKQAEVIMIWHIATSMCEYEIPAEPDTDFLKDFKIATSLSKYLAYLVAFAPRLLPDHPYVTEIVFDQVILEASDAFRGCNTLGERISELKHSPVQGELLDSGARLGKKLIENVMNPVIIWKVLADFWVELVVYVAPSNDTAAHADHLTMGGEFITHIWALLSHSGIEREPHESQKLERSRNCP